VVEILTHLCCFSIVIRLHIDLLIDPNLSYIDSLMPKISIPQKNLHLDIEKNSNLMNSLLAAGLPVASSCHGEGICSMCKVKITGLVNPAENFELETLKRNKCEPNERLSCQITVTSDLIVSAKYW